jgi:BolA family transcriptional regulator, general stress-responsive regulator
MRMSEQRISLIRTRLEEALAPELLEIDDESHLHAGHAGARDGRGHFRVTVVSTRFSGIPRIRRHQLVYTALGNLMQTDIHAMAIQALAPEDL